MWFAHESNGTERGFPPAPVSQSTLALTTLACAPERRRERGSSQYSRGPTAAGGPPGPERPGCGGGGGSGSPVRPRKPAPSPWPLEVPLQAHALNPNTTLPPWCHKTRQDEPAPLRSPTLLLWNLEEALFGVMLQENEVLPGDSFSASVTGCCEEQMNCL